MSEECYDMDGKTIKYSQPVWRETAYGVQDDYGVREQVMTLKKISKNSYNIEWEIFDEKGDTIDYAEIGVFTDENNPKKVIDYDGVFELPDKAQELLKKNGFDVSEVV